MPHRSASKPDGQVLAHDLHTVFAFLLIGGAIILRDLRVHASVILCIGCVAAAVFEYRDLETCVRKLLFTSVSLFFREIKSVGTEKLPRDGPLILVCAPHSNQFVDPAVVLYLLPTDFYTRGRRVGFLVAAKSWRRRVVGFFARMFDGVPVERPQDIARVGTGTLSVSADEPQVLRGVGTRFTAEAKAGDAIVFKHRCESPGGTEAAGGAQGQPAAEGAAEGAAETVIRVFSFAIVDVRVVDAFTDHLPHPRNAISCSFN
jgi:hypothetical protein